MRYVTCVLFPHTHKRKSKQAGKQARYVREREYRARRRGTSGHAHKPKKSASIHGRTCTEGEGAREKAEQAPRTPLGDAERAKRKPTCARKA